MRDKEPQGKCPVYTSDRFLLRPVEEGDAEDLLRCYSDASAVRLMNSDRCNTDFDFRTLNELNDYIRGWIGSHNPGGFVRLSIVDTQCDKAVGTIEMFEMSKDIGILRFDLCSAYETRDHLLELLALSVEGVYEGFGVRQILTKAIPAATERISALGACGFAPVEHHAILPFGSYYLHDRG